MTTPSTNPPTNPPTKDAVNAAAKKVVKFVSDNASKLAYLADRWRGEREYEDIAEYAAVLQPLAEAAGLRLVKVCKTPFGPVLEADGYRFRVTVASTSITVRMAK